MPRLQSYYYINLSLALSLFFLNHFLYKLVYIPAICHS